MTTYPSINQPQAGCSVSLLKTASLTSETLELVSE